MLGDALPPPVRGGKRSAAAPEAAPARCVDSDPRDTVIGTSTIRVDALAKVTGRAAYTSDLELPGMVHAAVVRNTVPHAVLHGVELGSVRAAPGVVGAFGAADLILADPFFGEWVVDQPVLAIDRVRFVGEPIAAVVAESRDAALSAAMLAEPHLTPLAYLASAAEALTEEAVAVHPERPSADPDLPNVCHEALYEQGDVDAAMASAAYVHRARYTFQSTAHYTMEPHATIAAWDGPDLTVWTGSQDPFKLRRDLARMFGVPQGRIRIIVPFIGGAYGSKSGCRYEPLVAALARQVGRPVKLVVSVSEAFTTVVRHAATVDMATAVDAAGNLVARDTSVVFDTGAYADKGPRVATKGAYRAHGPYGIPNTRSRALAVYSNTVPAGAFRGFSTPQVVWAGESAIDELSDHLGEDPLEFRLRHLIRRGDDFFAGDTPLDADLAAGVRAAADAVGWVSPKPAGRGRGLAVGVKDGGGGSGRSGAKMHLHDDGSVEVFVATSEIGQGSRTVLAQLAADRLGCGIDAISVRQPDTSSSPFDTGTIGSRSTITAGTAVQRAADRLVEQLQTVAGTEHEVRIEGAELVVGPTRTPLVQVLAQINSVKPGESPALVGRGEHLSSEVGATLGSRNLFYEVSHAAVEVEVDRDTGEIGLRRYASVADVGRALNPAACEGQDIGAAVQGIGHSLMEELSYVAGELVNGNLAEYAVPKTRHLPSEQFTSILIENADGPGPFGAKGLGEGGIIGTAPAIANAVFDATGVRVRDLPLRPERVWRHLQALSGSVPNSGKQDPT